MKLSSLVIVALLLQGIVVAQQTDTEKSPPMVSPDKKKQEEKIEGRFVGSVEFVKMAGKWEGKAVPIGFDQHFLVAVDILSIEKEAKLFDKKGHVVLLVHSPAKLFAGNAEEPIGKKFLFKIEGVLRDGKPVYSFAQAGEYKEPVKEIPIETFDDVSITPYQIEKAKQIAKNVCDREIEKIYVGQIMHPLPDMGVRLFFKDELADTYAVKRTIVIQFDYEEREKNRAAKHEVIDKTFRAHKLRTSVTRIFPLKKTTLQLYIPDELSYNQVKSLLTAIEDNSFKIKEEEDNLNVSDGKNTEVMKGSRPIHHGAIDLSKITRVEFEKESGSIKVETQERRFGGNVYTFKILPNSFELVEVGHWVS